MKNNHSTIPHIYNDEKDYRNIPREYLERDIPQGRGIVKWQPFKTMPQQYQILDQYIEDQNKIEIPLLSEDQLQLINEKVQYKMQKHLVADVSYWKDGYISTLQCYIDKIDTLEENMLVTGENRKNKFAIPLNHIVNIE